MTKEQGIFVGENTLTAELARQRRLYEGLKPGGSPGRYLATVLSAVLGRKAPGLTNQHPIVAAYAKAVLRWRGCSHETHTLSRRKSDFSPGLVIRNNLGLAVEYLPPKKLKAAKEDPEFTRIYAEELEKEGVKK